MSQLIAIGGNLQLDGSIIEDFFQRSGAADGLIVIIPTASAMVNRGMEYAQRFCELGSKNPPVILQIHTRADAFEEKYVELIRAATGIFFTGGDQLRLTTVIAGTPILTAVFERYQAGVVVAGTSAGAAALGKVMISTGRSGAGARSGMAQFAEGFGFVDQVIFDQHFHQRNRLGRLVFSVTVHPGSIGIGIDENTAIILEEDTFTVIGKNAVTVVDGHTITESNIDLVKNGDLFAVSHLRLTQLTAGSRFRLADRTAIIERIPLQTEPGIE